MSEPLPAPPLRVAILGTRGLPSGYSGYEGFAEQLGVRLVAGGHRVLVYCRRSRFEVRPLRYRGIECVYVPSLPTKSFDTLSHTLLSVLDLARRRADVALVCNVANAPVCLLLRAARIPVALNVDGLEWERPKWGPLGRRYFRAAASIAGSAADVVVTDARAMEDVYRSRFGARPVTITYGAEIVSSADTNIVRRYGLEPDEYFLIASRLVPDNNADLIVSAFRHVRTEKLLAIAGEAGYRSPWVERLRCEADPRVRFLGQVEDQAHVRELHCNAYAYVHGHEFGGTNPALLKALGCGNCVVALDTPFNREVLGDGGGLFFEKSAMVLAARLQELVGHPEKRDELARGAREIIRARYTWEQVTAEYEALFHRLRGDSEAWPRHSRRPGDATPR